MIVLSLLSLHLNARTNTVPPGIGPIALGNLYIYKLKCDNPEGKRPLRRLRRWWVDSIKMDLLEIRWGGVDWIGLAQDRDKWRALVNAVMNLRVT
jgi:hypothetical protein